jgi:hypothetical protein
VEADAKAVVVVVDGGREAVVGRIIGPRCDLALVEALARIKVEAQRRGCEIRLREVGPDLCELLQLVGLADLLVAGRSVEVGGQPAGREELGVQEVVDGGDLPA